MSRATRFFPANRSLFAALTAALLSACLSVASPAASSCPATTPPNIFGRLEEELNAELACAKPTLPKAKVYGLLNQLRNHEAIAALLLALPASKRPKRILYAASGDHMAPLVACAVDAAGDAPYTFVFTETDGRFQDGIEDFLKFLVQKKAASGLSSDPPLISAPGRRTWRFALGRHPVALTFALDSPEPADGDNRLYPAWALASSDLVVTHDWAGDQQENLRLVWELLISVRAARRADPPLLMMEDLSAHPYPVDLEYFSPVARTACPYGHRDPLKLGAGFPRTVELGPALYGGGVLLSFSDPWWRGLDDTALISVFNFLLFDEFDNERLNVVSGAPDPVLAPPLLDWISGFGYRAIDGQDTRTNKAIKAAMVEKAPILAEVFPPPLRKRWACRMALYRALLEMEAASTAFDDLLPSARWKRRAGDAGLPFANEAMADLYGEAMAHSEDYKAAKRHEHEDAARILLPLSRAPAYDAQARPCLDEPRKAWPSDAGGWRALYLSAQKSLRPAP